MFQSLGFVIHPDKSMLEPTTSLEFFDSRNITLTLTWEKKVAIKMFCIEVLTSSCISIRQVACLLGKFSSSFIAVAEGKLHFRDLEREKTRALSKNKGNFDKYTTLSEEANAEVLWWRDNIETSVSPILRDNPTIVITTDASLSGWGACGLGRKTGGHFRDTEKEEHINILETKAVLFGLKALCANINHKHIKVLTDNSATFGTINNMGSSKSIILDQHISAVWEWVLQNNNWITAAHIPGIYNVDADKESRKAETRTEWKLNSKIFLTGIQKLGFYPNIDLFASRINTQLPRFVAFRPDPEAEAIDAFSLAWTDHKFYAFPPFICVDRVLQKIINAKATGIVVVPDWPNQVWYHMFTEIIIADVTLPSRSDMLQLPSDLNMVHPLAQHLNLRMAFVSGINM